MTDPANQTAPPANIRRIATGLLILMAVIFLVTRRFETLHPLLGYLRAFSEAALVGALADWFAVTALFRHPLGLPIPHTAIIQKNKDRIGAGIANFLEHNFMTREVLNREFQRFDFAAAAARWLAETENCEAVAHELVSGIPSLLKLLDDQEVTQFLHGRVARIFQEVRCAPLLAELLSILVADRRHQALFDHLLLLVANALEKNQDYLRQKIHDNSPRWMPRAVDDKFFIRILDGLHDIIDDMRGADSEWRASFQLMAEELIDHLRTDPQYEARIAGMMHSLVQHPLVVTYIEQVWQDVRTRLVTDAVAVDSRAASRMAQGMQALSAALVATPSVSAKCNAWLVTFATEAVVHRRGVIAALVERVIAQWDGQTVSDKFAQYVGRDLQFIRINGTLVGGMVGVVLHAVSLML